MTMDDINMLPSIDQQLKKSTSMVEINTRQSIRPINNYDDTNADDDDDNFFFYNESSVEIQPLPDLDDNVEGRSSSSSSSPSSQSLLVSSFPTENYTTSSDRESELSMCDDEADDDNFFFFEIQNEVPLNDDHPDPCDNRPSSPPKSMSKLPTLRASHSASHLAEDIDTDCITPLRTLRRCQSQSILKSSSTYNTNSTFKNLHETTSSSSSSPKMKPSTSFSTLEIREYPITLGDNPGGMNGPPISLDWEHNKKQTQVIPLEDYEEERPQRRSRQEMYMADNTRRWRLLRERGVSAKEIDKATKKADSVRRQRRESIKRCGFMLNFRKKVGNVFGSVK